MGEWAYVTPVDKLLANANATVFRFCVEVVAKRNALAAALQGAPMVVNDFHGSVASITLNHINLKSASGEEKRLALTEANARALLEPAQPSTASRKRRSPTSALPRRSPTAQPPPKKMSPAPRAAAPTHAASKKR
jgi:hypothetical protein